MVGSLVASASNKTAKALATYIKRLPPEYHSVAAAAIKRRNEAANDPAKKISAKEFTDILIETAQLLSED